MLEKEKKGVIVTAPAGWYQNVGLELDCQCVPQIENVIKRGKKNLNESDKVSSKTFGYRWTEMRQQAASGRMNECVCHDAGKKSMN